MYTDLSKKQIYDNTMIGFTADFFSPLRRERIASKLTDALRRRVTHSKAYKSGEAITEGVRIYPNFFGGFKMNTVESGPMPYNEGINVLLKAMNAIDEFGFTNKKCKMKIRIWQDGSQMNLPKMEHLSITKFMLNINESEILNFWKQFNTEKVYKSSLKYVYPKNVFMTDMGSNLLENASMTSMKYPSSKFFGVGFENITKGYVEMRYVSGANYQRKKQQIVDVINNAIENVHESLAAKYTDNDRNKMSQVITEQRRIVEGMKTYKSFAKQYPLIELHVDLKMDEQVLTQRFSEMREKLFDLVVYGNMKAGKVNLDSGSHRMQVMGSNISNGFGISGIDFFECKVEADMENCGFQSCDIRSSSMRNSSFHSNNNVRSSAIFECSFIGMANTLHEAYVDNGRDKPIEAEITESIIRRGVVTMNSTVDSFTEMVEEQLLREI